MLYYTFTLVNEQREMLTKNDDDEFTSAINSAIGEVNNKMKGKAFALICSVAQKGRRLRAVAEILDYSITVDKIATMINEELNENYRLVNVNETTLVRFNTLASSAFDRDLAHFKLPEGLLDSDDYSYVIRRGNARESLIEKKMTGKTARKKTTELWHHIEGLKEEIERIFQRKALPYKGNPVHYAIEADCNSDRVEIRNLLASCLLEQNRIELKRITEINLDTISSISEDRVSSFLELERHGIVVISLYERCEISDSLTDLHQAMDELAALINKKKRDVLFIFEFSKSAEPTWKYIRSMLAEMNFIELKEKNLSNEESRDYLARLAALDNVKDRYTLQNLVEDSSYSISDLKAIYSSWYDRHLCTEVYPAYSDISLCDTEVMKQTKGNAYQKLESMIGLEEVRSVITSAIDYARVQTLYEKSGVSCSEMTRHMVFYGNPGTAKTTCARLYASIMKDNGLLKKGHLVEVGRKDIVSKYLGGTAPLIKEYFEKADGGVLFIDEAYSLVDEKKGLYGDEAINTIVQEMENRRDSVVVILAGYPEEMKSFLSRNPGLRSRISFHVHFRDYTDYELLEILKLFIKESGMNLDQDAENKLLKIFENAKREKDFGNGRFSRNLFERARLRQASRILHSESPSAEDIKTLIADDFTETEKREEIKHQIGFAL